MSVKQIRETVNLGPRKNSPGIPLKYTFATPIPFELVFRSLEKDFTINAKIIINKQLKLALSALLFSGLFFATGCEKSAEDQMEDAAEEAGQAVENAANGVQDALN